MRPFCETQGLLGALCVELCELDKRLEKLGASLPEPCEDFHAQAELRGAIESVRCDLLDDAILTLAAASRRSEAELRRLFERRRGLLGQAGGAGC